MKVKSIRKLETPVPSRCIEVDSPDKLFAAGGRSGTEVFSHNSVVQRNVIFATIMRPDNWYFIGIDLKKVELSMYRAYSNVVLGIATNLEDAILSLRFAQETMMRRYAQLESLGKRYFLELGEGNMKSLLVMIDETSTLLSPSGVNTEEGKEEDVIKGEAKMIISSIARLGRAAGVHLVLATQRPDADVIPGETKANLIARINCGFTDSTASNMILGNAEGTRVEPVPGRIYLSINDHGNHAQGLYGESHEWIDDYLESKGLGPDGKPLENRKFDESFDFSGRVSSLSGLSADQLEEQKAITEGSVAVEDDEGNWLEEDFDDLDSGQVSYEYVEEVEVKNKPGKAKKKDLVDGEAELKLSGDGAGDNKWNRPEDDWDEELEKLININNAKNPNHHTFEEEVEEYLEDSEDYYDLDYDEDFEEDLLEEEYD